MRDLINYIKHVEEDKQDIKYLNMVYDDINQLIEMVESYGDTINSTRELYIASVSLQMSDTMKTLTIFSAVLLPLTFIASVYGMNGMDLQRVLEIPNGIALVAATMAAVIGALFVYFKRKQWVLSNVGKAQIDKGGKEGTRNAEGRPSEPRKAPSGSGNDSDSSQPAERERYAEQSLEKD